MIFNFAAFQFILYLCIVPFFRKEYTELSINYSWSLSLVALASLYAGLFLFKIFFKNRISDLSKYELKFTNIGILILTFWVFVSFSISFNYNLFNRRIGTEELAMLFSSIPFYLLIIHRSLEVSWALIASIIFIQIIKYGFTKKNSWLIFLLFLSLAGTGAFFSRSLLIFLVIITFALLQNSIDRNLFKKSLIAGIAAGGIFFTYMSFYRLSSSKEIRGLTQYFSEELLQRADGLELVSRVAEIEPNSLLGINFSAIYNPIAASIPFLDAANKIKSEGLTSVKSVALNDTLGMQLYDYNSFIIFDTYYAGGVFLMSLSCILLGFLLSSCDRFVGIYRSTLSYAFWASVAVNCIILEREFIGIIIAIFRDTFIYFLLVKVLLIRKAINK